MKGILADINIQGPLDLLIARMQSEPWKLFWEHLQLPYLHFSDVDLASDSPDSLVWQTCQQRELILITENRNQKAPDSLESTIRTQSTSDSLPVVTIASVPRLRESREYADRVIDRLFDFFMRIDSLRGCGRLYVP